MSLRKDVKTGPIEQWQMYKTTLIATREALLKVALKKGPIYDDIRQDWTYVRPAGISPRWSYRHPEKTFSMSDAAGRRANIYHALEESHEALGQLVRHYKGAKQQDRSAFRQPDNWEFSLGEQQKTHLSIEFSAPRTMPFQE
jgi:hypothetical protein